MISARRAAVVVRDTLALVGVCGLLLLGKDAARDTFVTLAIDGGFDLNMVQRAESVNAGDVFRFLDRARLGDVIQVFAGPRRYDYRVSWVATVDRLDVSVLGPTDTPSISLVTCTGRWLTALHDFDSRLVVRGELAAV